jgi:hypothetical protein
MDKRATELENVAGKSVMKKLRPTWPRARRKNKA